MSCKLKPEISISKQVHENEVVFSIKNNASILNLIDRQEIADRPPWLSTLLGITILPSKKVNAILDLLEKAMQCIPRGSVHKLLQKVIPLSVTSALMRRHRQLPFQLKGIDMIKLKDKIALFLKAYFTHPIYGTPTRFDKILCKNLRLHQQVATPYGIGHLRGFKDDKCTILYTWGHASIHVHQVESIQEQNLEYQFGIQQDEYAKCILDPKLEELLRFI